MMMMKKKQISIWSWTILGQTPLYQLDSQSLKIHHDNLFNSVRTWVFTCMWQFWFICQNVPQHLQKIQCRLHSFPHLLQECLMLKFMFVFIQVNFKFFNAAPSLHVHVITLIQFVCHFHIGCMKSIFSCSSSISSSLISTFLFKFKFIVIQRKLIFSIPSPDIKLMWLMWFHLHIHISTVIA